MSIQSISWFSHLGRGGTSYPRGLLDVGIINENITAVGFFMTALVLTGGKFVLRFNLKLEAFVVAAKAQPLVEAMRLWSLFVGSELNDATSSLSRSVDGPVHHVGACAIVASF